MHILSSNPRLLPVLLATGFLADPNYLFDHF